METFSAKMLGDPALAKEETFSVKMLGDPLPTSGGDMLRMVGDPDDCLPGLASASLISVAG